MATSHASDGPSNEVRNISIEEFRRAEFLACLNPQIDVDLIEISNRNLHFKTVHNEFLKFSNFIAQPLYEDNFKDLLTFVFLHLYLLLLLNNGESEAQKFLRSFQHLPFHSDVVDNLLYAEPCKNVLEFLKRHFKSKGRIRVKFSKNAYTTLLKWLEDCFSKSVKMFNILRVLHENFLVDIYDDKNEDSVEDLNDEGMKEILSWFEPFMNPVEKKKSQFKATAGTSKTPENEKELLDIRKMIKQKGHFSKDPESVVDESSAKSEQKMHFHEDRESTANIRIVTPKRAKNEEYPNEATYYLFEFKKACETDFHAAYPIISENDKISSSDISPDLCYMAIGFESCKICTWRLGGDSIALQLIGTLEGHKGIISALAIDSRNKCLISGSHDHTVRIWDIEQSICTKILSEHFAPVYDICVSPNSMYFVTASEDKRICLFWYDDIHQMGVFTGHSQKATNCLQFHPNGMYFACACADGNLFLFQINLTCRPVRMYHKHKCNVYTLSFSPLLKHLASADVEGVIIIWDILTYSPIKILETGYGIGSISYDISGSFLVALSDFKPLTVYNIEGENIDLVIESKGHLSPKSLHFSTDNRMLIIQRVEADRISELKKLKTENYNS